MNKITNVVIVNDFDYIQGGASKVAIQTANIIKENNPNINVYFFSGDHNDLSNLNNSIINICTYQGEALKNKNKLKGAINGIYNFKAKKELNKLLNSLDNKETIIHIHGWTKCLSSSIYSSIFKMNFKNVLTLHDYFTACPNGGYFNYKTNKICKYNPMSVKCKKCNCDSRNYIFKIYRIIRQFVQNRIVKLNQNLQNVISISEFSENILKKTLNKNTNITRIYNPIDLDNEQQKVEFKNNEYYLYVGRVSKEKGVDIFCKALTELQLKGIVVGDGSERLLLEKQYPNIEFVGWKNSTQVKEYMKKARALIFPSRWYEGAPLTPLEILQYGIPCIISDSCAGIDYLKDSYNGISFSIEKDDLTDKITEFENKIDKINFNIENFVNSNYYNKIMELYTKILNKEQ